MVEIGKRRNFYQRDRQKQRERGRRKERAGKRDGLRVKWSNLISVLIKPNLFWRVTETAPCHHADLQGSGAEDWLSPILSERVNEGHLQNGEEALYERKCQIKNVQLVLIIGRKKGEEEGERAVNDWNIHRQHGPQWLMRDSRKRTWRAVVWKTGIDINHMAVDDYMGQVVMST